MKANPALDNSLRHLLTTSSITRENSVPGGNYRPELKIMFKVPWVFLKIPSLSTRGIDSRRSLVRYLKANQETYVCGGHRVLTRDIWNIMPNELETVIALARILHSHPVVSIESLLTIIKRDEVIQTRLRNVLSIQEFLSLYSNFFGVDENGAITTTIKAHPLNANEKKETTKVNSLVAMEFIQGFFETHKDLKSCPNYLPVIHVKLQSRGFGITLSQLQKFIEQFYQFHPTSEWEIPQRLEPHPSRSGSEDVVATMIPEILKGWPINMGQVRTELEHHGVTMNNSSLRNLIETRFPDYIIRNGIVSQDHEAYLRPIQKILTDQCPMTISELRMLLITQGLALSRKVLNEVIVKSLDDYFISQGQIYLPTSNGRNGETMADFVLEKLHELVEGLCPLLLDDLPAQLAIKGIEISKKKVKMIIAESSTLYKCRGNYLLVNEIPQPLPTAGNPQSLIELVTFIKSLKTNQDHLTVDSSGRGLFKKAFLDSLLGNNAIYQQLQSFIVTEDGIGIAHELHYESNLASTSSPDPKTTSITTDAFLNEAPSQGIMKSSENQQSADPPPDNLLSVHPVKPSPEALVTLPVPSNSSDDPSDGTSSVQSNENKAIAERNPDDMVLNHETVKKQFPEWDLYLEEAMDIAADGVNTTNVEIEAPSPTRESTNVLLEPIQSRGSRSVLRRFSDREKMSKDNDNCILS
ncbi:hypothetical protein TCAL_06327 [Tigriopus californicus]|uniref:Uncharacterized protein n=1 Tax=Tigriopus californicus TaxID=6832 RepID=A0A553PBR2_TIGCA|nr:uncharacterized protein LOC131892874 [Tigriopus californicus]XP_059098723.1 uncharacterized protein LOC131892874 [Tigriopus californicus]TRY75117.1 hypothetical protein TCAL_06327 [Tigriopus californicus]|eukprot:TCALIF_06327-PA protein Name:"Protein of unknown function" AED:0.00 eAED:0.00 QI:393/1/1/1/0.5/0.33/3/79/694